MASTMPKQNSEPQEYRMWLERLAAALAPLDHAALECDGMTNSVSNLLRAADIDHQSCLGHVVDATTGDTVVPHCWIAFEGGWVLDFRLRMWLGERPEIPHGLISPLDQTRFAYHGTASQVPMLSKSLLAILTDGLSVQVDLSEFESLAARKQ